MVAVFLSAFVVASVQPASALDWKLFKVELPR